MELFERLKDACQAVFFTVLYYTDGIARVIGRAR